MTERQRLMLALGKEKMLVVRSKVQQLVKQNGKRMTKDAWIALDSRIMAIIQSASKLCNGHKTITDTEILMANRSGYNSVPKEEV